MNRWLWTLLLAGSILAQGRAHLGKTAGKNHWAHQEFRMRGQLLSDHFHPGQR